MKEVLRGVFSDGRVGMIDSSRTEVAPTIDAMKRMRLCVASPDLEAGVVVVCLKNNGHLGDHAFTVDQALSL